MTEPKKPSAIKAWMMLATVAEQDQLARRAGTTRGMLYQYVANRRPSAEKAAAIEQASIAMSKASKGRLPVIFRSDLSTACAQCHFAQRCLGIKAEFNLIGRTK